jgi:hypothetical protein
MKSNFQDRSYTALEFGISAMSDGITGVLPLYRKCQALDILESCSSIDLMSVEYCYQVVTDHRDLARGMSSM